MPVDRSKLNNVGDLVLTDAAELRVLADPRNMRLFDLVRALGPATSAQLAIAIEEDEEPIRNRLAAMEAANLIEASGDSPRRWSTPARGIYFEIPEDGEDAQRAARSLSSSMLARASALPAKWAEETEPQLSVGWARAAGLFNARLALTAEELRRLQEDLERLLEPFNTRDANTSPSDTAMVRVLAFFMPDPASPAEPD